jgi:hypothetical protein
VRRVRPTRTERNARANGTKKSARARATEITADGPFDEAETVSGVTWSDSVDWGASYDALGRWRVLGVVSFATPSDALAALPRYVLDLNEPMGKRSGLLGRTRSADSCAVGQSVLQLSFGRPTPDTPARPEGCRAAHRQPWS